MSLSRTKRPDRGAHWTVESKTLSYSTAPGQLLFSRDRSTSGLLNQQFLYRCIDRSCPLSLSLADRAVLQMDQTTLKNQTLLWHLAQQRQDSDLDCCGHLRAYRDYQKEACSETKPLHYILQILSVTLFEKVPILSLFENCDDASELDDSGKQWNLFHY